MKKKFQRVSEINLRMKAIADSMEKENRSMTEAETAEVRQLEREKSFLTLQIHSSGNLEPEQREDKPVALRSSFRSMIATGKDRYRVQLREEGAVEETVEAPMSTEDATNGGLLPVTIGNIVNPLRQALIYDKIGIQMPTGCVGSYEWPVVEAVKATIAGENVKVGARKINLSKVSVARQRIAVVVEASRESLLNSDGKLEGIINEQMPLAMADVVNQVITSPTKVTDDCSIKGPFVGKTAEKIEFTFKGLNAAKAKLLAKGVSSARMVWVMTEATKAVLEATPKDTGSGIMCIEDDRLCGVPVFTSEHIGENNIGLGDFTYQVCGQFGNISLIVDPYTGADSNTVRFALNADFGTATLKDDAFALFTSK